MEKYLKKIDKILDIMEDTKELEAQKLIKELRTDLVYDIALKNSSNKYQKEQIKAAKDLLKNADNDRPLLKKIYKIDDTYQLCDGFVGVVLNKMIEGLELNTIEDEYFDCRSIMKTSSGNYFEYDDNYKKVEYDLLELEQKALQIKRLKDKTLPVEFLIQYGEAHYNSMYLLRAIKILGTENVEIYASKTGIRSLIYLKSELGQAIVVPILINKNN